jgi:hypothetical protein
MNNFTPASAAVGGALIGLSAVFLMLFTGRIAGVSGIFDGLINPQTNDRAWRAAFIRRPYRCPYYRCACWLPRLSAADARQLHHNRCRRPPGRIRRSAW